MYTIKGTEITTEIFENPRSSNQEALINKILKGVADLLFTSIIHYINWSFITMLGIATTDSTAKWGGKNINLSILSMHFRSWFHIFFSFCSKWSWFKSLQLKKMNSEVEHTISMCYVIPMYNHNDVFFSRIKWKLLRSYRFLNQKGVAQNEE